MSGVRWGSRRLRFAARGDAQFRAARSWIPLNFFAGRAQRLFGQYVVAPVIAKGVFDQSIFSGMKTDHGDSATRPQAIRKTGQRALQVSQLVVHRDPQCLKGPSGPVDGPLAARTRHAAAYDFGLICLGGKERNACSWAT